MNFKGQINFSVYCYLILTNKTVCTGLYRFPTHLPDQTSEKKPKTLLLNPDCCQVLTGKQKIIIQLFGCYFHSMSKKLLADYDLFIPGNSRCGNKAFVWLSVNFPGNVSKKFPAINYLLIGKYLHIIIKCCQGIFNYILGQVLVFFGGNFKEVSNT